MSKVNFVSEFNLFMRYARDNGLSLRERMLWIALFYIANDRAVYNEQTNEYEWPDDFIRVSNSELNLYCCLDKRAIETLRNGLKQRGLIDFLPGEKNKRNPAYRLLYLSMNVGYKKVPNYDPNHTPNNVPNYAPNNAPNYAPNMSPFIKYKYTAGDNEMYGNDEDDDEDSFACMLARARTVIQTAYRSSFGSVPTTAEVDGMALAVANMNLVDVADKALLYTAQAGPVNRLAYFKALCADWHAEYIRTPEELSDHLTLQNMARNYPDMASEYIDKAAGAREARRCKYAGERAIV